MLLLLFDYGNATCFVEVLYKYNPVLEQALAKSLHLNEFVPYNAAVSETARVLCRSNSPVVEVCRGLYSSCGPSGQINDSIVSVELTNVPSGASFKQALHYLQLAKSGKFRQYDYLEEGNIKQYGQSTPPDYNLSAVAAPVVLYYGSTDYLVVEADVAILVGQLPNLIETVMVSAVDTNHFDVVLGARAKEFVTRPALTILNKYNNL